MNDETYLALKAAHDALKDASAQYPSKSDDFRYGLIIARGVILDLMEYRLGKLDFKQPSLSNDWNKTDE